MTCPDAERLAVVAVAGAQSDDLAALRHLDHCPACALVVGALGPGMCDSLDDADERSERQTHSDRIEMRDGVDGMRWRDPEPGDTVGRYVIVSRVGEGGMGVVSAAYDPRLDRTVALKSIRADRATPALARRLEREAQALARLTHRHLVPVFDAGIDHGRLYLAMELVDGVTLTTWLAQTERSTPEIVRVFREVADGLAAVHAASLVHRDVKPDNILIEGDGTARLADFGLVTSADDHEVAPHSGSTDASPASPCAGSSMTEPFTAVGTPAYMAPEQRRGEGADARSDQWSWATALADALRGRSLERRLRRVLARATDADPQQRFATMADVVRLLARRRARRWVGLAGLLVASAVAATLGVVAQARDTAPCEGASAGITRDWPESARAIGEAFRASGHPSWNARFDTAARAATAWAHHWGDTAIAVCHTERIARRSVSTERACLEQQRATARSLFGELARADRAAVDQAPIAVSRLPRAATCLEPGALGGLEAPTLLTASLNAELRTWRARVALRPPAELLAGLSALVSRARMLRAAQLEADAALMLGELQARLRQDTAASITLESAAQAAARARDDRAAALARMLQALQAGLAHDSKRADTLVEVAVAAVERAGNPAELRGQLAHVLGQAAGTRGDYETALDHYRAAVVAWTEAFGPDDTRVAAAHQNVGATLQQLGRWDEARVALERAVAILETGIGADHPNLAWPLTGLGTIAASQRRFDDAQQLFERSRALRITTYGPDHPEVAMCENNLGKLAQLRGDPRDAIAHFARSRSIVERLGARSAELALPLSGLGAAHAVLHEWGQAAPLLERAIAITEATLGKDHPSLIAMLVTLSTVRSHTRGPSSQRQLLERARAIATTRLGPDHERTRSVIALLARWQRSPQARTAAGTRRMSLRSSAPRAKGAR